MKWQPIHDLPHDVAALTKPELQPLAAVWQEQKSRLSSELQALFLEKLERQWAIETGILEHLYALDRGITQVLIEKGINASLIPSEATDRDPELVAAIINDQKSAIEGVFDFVKGNRVLSTSYIKELHALLTQHQHTVAAVNGLGRKVEMELKRGDYKILPNNPTRPDGTLHEYSPPEHVSSEMDKLVELYQEYQASHVSPEVLAAWLHHRFTQIHPFQDGNGRVARALASLVFIKSGWFPLVVTRDERERYIDALEAADGGDLAPLTDLFAGIERQAFVNALSIAGDVRQRQQVRQVIEAAKDIFVRREEALRREWEESKATAGRMQKIAENRLQQIAGELKQQLARYSDRFDFRVDAEPPNGERGYYFRNQIIQTAKQLGYFANPSLYASWVRLVLWTDTQAEILVSFHGIGHDFRGVLASSVCFFRREEIEEGQRELADLIAVSDRVFQINYREPIESAEQRFRESLEIAIIKALDVWRTGL